MNKSPSETTRALMSEFDKGFEEGMKEAKAKKHRHGTRFRARREANNRMIRSERIKNDMAFTVLVNEKCVELAFEMLVRSAQPFYRSLRRLADRLDRELK